VVYNLNVITRELLSFISTRRVKKISDDEIRQELQKAGWKSQDIEFALKSDLAQDTPLPPYDNINIFDKETHESKWDMFLNVLMFISMYISIYSMVDIIFKVINYYLPIRSRYSGSFNSTGGIYGIEGPLSALIVTMPLFLFLFNKVEKLAKENTWIKTVKTRATLVYATLTVAFVTFVISGISIVNSLIRGNLSVNFVAKILTVLFFAFTVFSYFIKEVRSGENTKD